MSGDVGEELPVLGFDMPLDPNEPKYCICHGVSHGEMIACDNKECLTEWFHMSCVGLTENPKGKWYCNQCYGPMVSSYRKKRAQVRARARSGRTRKAKRRR